MHARNCVRHPPRRPPTQAVEDVRHARAEEIRDVFRQRVRFCLVAYAGDVPRSLTLIVLLVTARRAECFAECHHLQARSACDASDKPLWPLWPLGWRFQVCAEQWCAGTATWVGNLHVITHPDVVAHEAAGQTASAVAAERRVRHCHADIGGSRGLPCLPMLRRALCLPQILHAGLQGTAGR